MFLFDEEINSISLSSNTRKACTIDVLWSGWEHFTKDSKIFDVIELSSSGEH